jgi:hypothetical protein
MIETSSLEVYRGGGDDMEDIEDDDDDESRFLRQDFKMGGIFIWFVAGVWIGVLDLGGGWIGVFDLVGGCRLGSLDLDEDGGC